MHGVDHADEVDVERVDEGLNRKVRAEWTDARIGDHHVQSVEFCYGPCEFAGQRATIPDIDLGGVGPSTGLLDLQTGLFKIERRRQRVFVRLDVVADVEQDDVRTLLGQLDRVAAALTAGAAGNQDHFVLYSSHQSAFHSGLTLGRNTPNRSLWTATQRLWRSPNADRTEER